MHRYNPHLGEGQRLDYSGFYQNYPGLLGGLAAFYEENGLQHALNQDIPGPLEAGLNRAGQDAMNGYHPCQAVKTVARLRSG